MLGDFNLDLLPTAHPARTSAAVPQRAARLLDALLGIRLLLAELGSGFTPTFHPSAAAQRGAVLDYVAMSSETARRHNASVRLMAHASLPTDHTALCLHLEAQSAAAQAWTWRRRRAGWLERILGDTERHLPNTWSSLAQVQETLPAAAQVAASRRRELGGDLFWAQARKCSYGSAAQPPTARYAQCFSAP